MNNPTEDFEAFDADWFERRETYAQPNQLPALLLGVGIGAILGAILGAACTMAGIAFAFFTSGAR